MSGFIDAVIRESSYCTERQKHCGHHTKVADAVGNKSFFAGNCSRVAGMPERNEEVRASANALPPKEGDEQVFAEHQHEHREHEQVEVQEKLRKLWIAVHVTNCIEVNQRTNTSDKQRHRDRQRVCQQRHVYLQRANWQPLKHCHYLVALFSRARKQIEKH